MMFTGHTDQGWRRRGGVRDRAAISPALAHRGGVSCPEKRRSAAGRDPDA